MTKASEKLRFTKEEWRACLALSMLYGLRMLGLFLVFPILAAESKTLEGGADPMWIGIAVGIYGLTQALFQIPFGMASDRIGRRKVILFGLAVFALGLNSVSLWMASLAWFFMLLGLTVTLGFQAAPAPVPMRPMPVPAPMPGQDRLGTHSRPSIAR